MMDAHEATSIFPMLGKKGLEDLATSIREGGQILPAVVHEGKLLDGRNRAKACELAGVELWTREWDGEGGTPLRYIIASNLTRRQLTPGQKAVAAAKALPFFEAEAKERKATSGPGKYGGEPLGIKRPEAVKGRATERAAEEFGSSAASVKRAKRLLREAPGEAEKVESGDKTLGSALTDAGQRQKWEETPDTKKRAKRTTLTEALAPLRKYLKGWTPEALGYISPTEARRQLAILEKVSSGLFDVARELEAHSHSSRALR